MHSPWWKDPEWWQAILIVAGTIVAYRAFISERNAVQLTERADVLIESIMLASPGPEIKTFPLRHASIEVRLKNFGPTRASDFILTDIRAEIGTQFRIIGMRTGAPQAIGGQHSTDIGFGPLKDCFDDTALAAVMNKVSELKFSFGYSYADVFGTVTEATSVVRFIRGPERFDIEHQERQRKTGRRKQQQP